jgi:hypothetical protein
MEMDSGGHIVCEERIRKYCRITGRHYSYCELAVSIVTRLWGSESGSIPNKGKYFLLYTASRPTLGHKKSTIKIFTGTYFPDGEESGRQITLAHSAPRLKMRVALKSPTRLYSEVIN